MKNTIILVSIISAAIIFLVIAISFFKENPDVSLKRDEYTRPVEIQPFDLELNIVTSEANFWERVAGLKATEAPEVFVTDENGETVTDEEGNPVVYDENAAVTSVPEDEAEPEETTVKKGKK
ncbi:hypothetical protein [Ruminococcus sp. HUN007]|uniref:hypothetical protein n=1 Tax=Ruminococcus sp. HUN007 TaxID=1514668 RepID=UPI0005D2B74C|nr:hypothetical protein [Ruminococcus sp. HUN007]